MRSFVQGDALGKACQNAMETRENDRKYIRKHRERILNGRKEINARRSHSGCGENKVGTMERVQSVLMRMPSSIYSNREVAVERKAASEGYMQF